MNYHWASVVAAWIPTDGVYDFSFSSHSTAFPVLNSANSELQQKVNRWSLPEVKAYLQMQVHNAMHKYLFSLRTFTSSYVLESFGVWFFCFVFFEGRKRKNKNPQFFQFLYMEQILQYSLCVLRPLKAARNSQRMGDEGSFLWLIPLSKGFRSNYDQTRAMHCSYQYENSEWKLSEKSLQL